MLSQWDIKHSIDLDMSVQIWRVDMSLPTRAVRAGDIKNS